MWGQQLLYLYAQPKFSFLHFSCWIFVATGCRKQVWGSEELGRQQLLKVLQTRGPGEGEVPELGGNRGASHAPTPEVQGGARTRRVDTAAACGLGRRSQPAACLMGVGTRDSWSSVLVCSLGLVQSLAVPFPRKAVRVPQGSGVAAGRLGRCMELVCLLPAGRGIAGAPSRSLATFPLGALSVLLPVRKLRTHGSAVFCFTY